MGQNKKTRVAVYTRVSSDEQTKGYSLDFQCEEIVEMIKKDTADFNNRHVYVDDGYTGINGNRPALKAMLEAAKRGEFQVIYVWKIDRLFRNTKLVLNLVDDLANVGVGIKSVLEPFCDSSTAIGRYMFTMLAAGAEMEHANINERTYAGKVRAMRAGKWLGGTPPYGYDLDPETSKLKLNKKEEKWVKRFYNWFVNERLTLFKLQERINALGIPTKHTNLGRNHKITGSTFWAKRTIGRLLSNDIYTGQFYYRRYKYAGRSHKDTEMRPKSEWIFLPVPPIISQEQYSMSLTQLKKNIEDSKRKMTRLYMFAKKLSCGVCGHRLNAAFNPPRSENAVGTRYYKGAWVLGQSTDKKCENCRFYSEPRIDKGVWSALKVFLSNPTYVIGKIERHLNGLAHKDDVVIEQARLLEQEKTLEVKEERLLNTYLEGYIDKLSYKKKVSELLKNKETLNEMTMKLSQSLLSNEERVRRVGSAEALYLKMRKLLNEATYETKCRIINVLVEKVSLTGNSAEVEMRLPFKEALPQFNKVLVPGMIQNSESLWDRRGVG